ncbi:MAG: DUF169 domain-containing protein [bacterium]|nr:DUF169 domain-containing protein [bacterium]
MQTKSLIERFARGWNQYFPGAELPIAFYYSDERGEIELVDSAKTNRCLIASLIRVRSGTPLAFDEHSIGCAGGKRYSGFSFTLRRNFEYFLSCGIEGEMEGERYKKSPEIVRQIMEKWPKLTAPKKYLIFKRWDLLENSDEPEAVIFFTRPDVLAGLYTLAGFDEIEDRVLAPFGAGCATVVLHPYLQNQSETSHCIIGMFDLSARPFVPADVLTFSVPMKKFVKMVENMDESFLITETWGKISGRMERSDNKD